MIKESVEECKACNGYGGNVWGDKCSVCDGDGAVIVRVGIPNGRTENMPFSKRTTMEIDYGQ